MYLQIANLIIAFLEIANHKQSFLFDFANQKQTRSQIGQMKVK